MANTIVGDFILCRKEANYFYGLAQSLVLEDPFNLVSGACYPYAVNMALACELYMKALMIVHTSSSTFTRGHDLESLFNQLGEDLQRKIESEFQRRIASLHGFKYFLKSQKNVFKDWRYAFEQNGVDRVLDYTGFSTFGSILNEITNGIDNRLTVCVGQYAYLSNGYCVYVDSILVPGERYQGRIICPSNNTKVDFSHGSVVRVVDEICKAETVE